MLLIKLLMVASAAFLCLQDTSVQRWESTASTYAENVPTDVTLTLIAVETGGYEDMHNPKKKFYGLLQMGVPAAADVGLARDDAMSLRGNGRRSVEAFGYYMKRYNARWNYALDGAPDRAPLYLRAALLWKAGPRFSRAVRDELRKNAGLTLMDAVHSVQERYRIASLFTYIERVKRAWSCTDEPTELRTNPTDPTRT